MNPGATGDYFPGHYDPDYARRQGQPTIYANSLHVFGMLDRAVSEWAGPHSLLLRPPTCACTRRCTPGTRSP